MLPCRIWGYIRTDTVKEIHKLELLTRMTWLTPLIKNLTVELSWDVAFHEAFRWENGQSKIRGEMEDYLFADRQAALVRLVEAGHVGNEEVDPEYYEDGKLVQFSSGPDGMGSDSFIANADDAIKSLEMSIMRLPNLQRFVWQTAILPMSSHICRHLSNLSSLRLLQLEQQGEFRSSSEYEHYQHIH